MGDAILSTPWAPRLFDIDVNPNEYILLPTAWLSLIAFADVNPMGYTLMSTPWGPRVFDTCVKLSTPLGLLQRQPHGYSFWHLRVLTPWVTHYNVNPMGPTVFDICVNPIGIAATSTPWVLTLAFAGVNPMGYTLMSAPWVPVVFDTGVNPIGIGLTSAPWGTWRPVHKRQPHGYITIQSIM
jgi:hypothetical protein